MRLFRFYVLCDPFTEQIRYVGKTVSELKQRWSAHVSNARYGRTTRTHCGKWIRSVINRGRKPEIIELESVVGEQSVIDETERFWISYFRMIGADLTNGTDGGDGWAMGDRNPMRDPIARARYSAVNKGRKFTSEHKAAIAAGLRNMKPEKRAAHTAMLVERNKSEKQREASVARHQRDKANGIDSLAAARKARWAS